MPGIRIQIFDGHEPTEFTLDETPADFNDLFLKISNRYPDRGRSLTTESFRSEFMQTYTFFLNKQHVTSRSQKISDGDEILILENLSGG